MTSTRTPAEAASSVAHGGRGVEEMLEVVEEEQELPSAEEAGEVVRRSDRLRDLRGTSSGSERPASGTQKTPSRSRPDELGGDLEREPGLPGAARAGEGEQARPVREQRDELVELVAPARRAESTTMGRFVASSVRSGGKSPSPSW